MAARTPSQTIGPFYHFGLRWPDGGKVAFSEKGKPVVLMGRIVDGAGDPVGDALVETWQHSAAGASPASASGSRNPHGFGRTETAKDGSFRIDTMMPGGNAPAIDVAIFARGLLKPLRTRVYLAPEDVARRDPVITSIADSPRVKTLVATPRGGNEYLWDVRLQGEGETVFFAF
ncbi:MAG TPA: protocatechuate 3,4-dioxygenase subunit alpha [Usitatibacter sp.]